MLENGRGLQEPFPKSTPVPVHHEVIIFTFNKTRPEDSFQQCLFYLYFQRDAFSPSVCICAPVKLGVKTNSQYGYLWFYGPDSAGMSLAPFSAPPTEGLVSPAEQVKVQLQLVRVLSWLWSVCAANKGTECLCRVSQGGWGTHLMAHCYSHTFCEVTAETSLAVAFPTVHVLLLQQTQDCGNRSSIQVEKNRTCRLMN